jgi:hypothetical protein
MTTTTRGELTKKASDHLKAARKATPGERTALLRKARNYYEEAGYHGMAAWCQSKMG